MSGRDGFPSHDRGRGLDPRPEMEQLITRILAHDPKIELFVFTVGRNPSRPDIDQDVLDFNHWLNQFPVKVIDYDLWASTTDRSLHFDDGDTVHPNKEGYMDLGEFIIDSL